MAVQEQTLTQTRPVAIPVITAVAILALAHMVIDFYATSITPLLPRFVQVWHLTPTSLGTMAAATSLTGSLLQPLFGLFLDRRGTSGLAALSLVWLAASVALIGWMPSYAALFALATVTILGSAIFHPLGAALARRVTPLEQRGLYMSLFMNVGNFGWAIAPAIITWYASTLGLRAMAWLAVPGLLMAIPLLRLRISLNHEQSIPEGSPKPITVGTPTSQPQAAESGKALPDSGLRLRGVVFLVAATVLRSWVASGIQTFLPTYMVLKGHSLTSSGSALTIFLLAGTVSGFFFGYFSDRFGRKPLLAGSLALAAVGLFWFLGAPPAWSTLAIALTGAALFGSLPLTVVLIQEMLPNHAGTGSGLIIGFAGGLGGLLVMGSGALATSLGLKVALYWLIPALPIASLCALAIPRHFSRS